MELVVRMEERVVPGNQAGRRQRRLQLNVKRTILAGCGLLCLVCAGYLLLFGKLFPYAPIIVGFTLHEQDHSIVHVQHGASFDSFGRIDSLIPGVEKFHRMKFRNKPEIFIFRDDDSYLERSLTRARFCVYYNSRLFISPWALREDAAGTISLETYLRHELSHSLLYQNAGLVNAIRFPDWFLEGLAVFSADQMGTAFYPGRDEIHSLVRSGNFMPPAYFKTALEDTVPLAVRYRQTFIYSEFACIVEWLVNTEGMDKLLQCLQILLDGGEENTSFKTVYGRDGERLVAEFRQHVQQSAGASVR